MSVQVSKYNFTTYFSGTDWLFLLDRCAKLEKSPKQRAKTSWRRSHFKSH